MTDGEYDSFIEFYRDREVQKHLADVRQCLHCDEWQAMVILLLTARTDMDISIRQQPEDPEDDEPWRK